MGVGGGGRGGGGGARGREGRGGLRRSGREEGIVTCHVRFAEDVQVAGSTVEDCRPGGGGSTVFQLPFTFLRPQKSRGKYLLFFSFDSSLYGSLVCMNETNKQKQTKIQPY